MPDTKKYFRNHIKSNRNQIIFHISGWFGAKRTYVWLQINTKMLNTIRFRVDLMIFWKYFPACSCRPITSTSRIDSGNCRYLPAKNVANLGSDIQNYRMYGFIKPYKFLIDKFSNINFVLFSIWNLYGFINIHELYIFKLSYAKARSAYA